MPKPPSILQGPILRRLRDALREDAAWHDVTTRSSVPEGQKARGAIIAKDRGVLAGLPVAQRLFHLMDRRCRLKVLVGEGRWFRPGQVVARIDGPARALLSAERVALNFLSRLSGIATLTRRYAVQTGKGRLYDTRKTTPLWRELERYAVRVGGGVNHRFDLRQAILLKDNHLALCGGAGPAVRTVRRHRGPHAVIEVEVENPRQALQALRAGADILLADNVSPSRLRSILRLARGKADVEVSGGLDLRTVKRFARHPVQRLSVGALTHSAPSVDFSLELLPA